MKMSQEMFKELQDAISEVETDAIRDAYEQGQFARADRVKDLNERYRWDLFWAVRPTLTVNPYEEGLGSQHIDTALRRIVTPIGRKF